MIDQKFSINDFCNNITKIPLIFIALNLPYDHTHLLNLSNFSYFQVFSHILDHFWPSEHHYFEKYFWITFTRVYLNCINNLSKEYRGCNVLQVQGGAIFDIFEYFHKFWAIFEHFWPLDTQCFEKYGWKTFNMSQLYIV